MSFPLHLFIRGPYAQIICKITLEKYIPFIDIGNAYMIFSVTEHFANSYKIKIKHTTFH